MGTALGLVQGVTESDFIRIFRITLDKKRERPSIIPENTLALIAGACQAVGPVSYDLIQNEAKANPDLRAHMDRYPLLILKSTRHPKVLEDALAVADKNVSRDTPGAPLTDLESVDLAKIIGLYASMFGNKEAAAKGLAGSWSSIISLDLEPELARRSFDFIAKCARTERMGPSDRFHLMKLCFDISAKQPNFEEAAISLAVDNVQLLDEEDGKKILARVSELRSEAEKANNEAKP
jgi:hypothetical protein